MDFRPRDIPGLRWEEIRPGEEKIDAEIARVLELPADSPPAIQMKPHAALVSLGPTYEWRVNVRSHHTSGAERIALFMHGHGGNCNFALWSYFWPTLVSAGFHLLAFDSPGFGRSSGTTAQTMKWKQHDHELVLQLLRAFGAPAGKSAVTVFGQCMGGAMFLRAFCKEPSMFAATHILHNCTIGTWPDDLPDLLASKGGGVLSFWKADADHMRESNVYKKFTQLQHDRPELCTFIDLERHTPRFLACSGIRCAGSTRATPGDEPGTGECIYVLQPSNEALSQILSFVQKSPRAVGPSQAPTVTALQRGGVPNKSFRVFVRVRPLLPREAKQSTCLDVAQLENWEPPPKWDGPPPDKIVAGGLQGREFVFDRVFERGASQEEVYQTVGKPIVDSVLAGHNACLFAYGQTGSGKTHTMEGEHDPGLMTRCIEYLCSALEPSAVLSTTFVQLYNENLLDLFAPLENTLGIVDSEHGAEVTGAKALVSRNMHEILDAVRQGAQYRVSGATNMNDASSRSHAILSIRILEQGAAVNAEEPTTTSRTKRSSRKEPAGSGRAAVRAKAQASGRVFHLVDLAGSERVKRSGASGVRFDEAVAINSALLHLGIVVSALVECDGAPRSYIPYRDSVLTRLLQNALGGKSRTALVACVTPAADSISETLSTLDFATRATHIKNQCGDDSSDELPAKEEEALEANRYAPAFNEDGKTRITSCGVDVECYGSWKAGPQAPLVVLLHYYGFGGGARMWYGYFEELESSGARYLAPNFPGHEGTAGQSSSRAEDMAKPGGPVEILKSILDTLGEKKVILVGFDWGGGIAAEFALTFPKRVNKLALWCMSYRDVAKAARLAPRKKDIMFMWDKHDVNRSAKKGVELAAAIKTKYHEYDSGLLSKTLAKWIKEAAS
eukprot:gnl/TRDRNA2_/TRDRNA2_40276_c0_seq1.p1 gnl/TRDRNA2_/TRDRNA2_40276_c0~~gnl/TRDRNA2_/TRDRNA2_40276_c0_seq1.p1  ORF type:complete len:910 (-),score=145.67 gnl/TRDRNA2_/TRDRNA2_40276_c0_seq1:115-2811(-)